MNTGIAITMNDFKPRRCLACDRGTIRPVTRSPGPVVIPTCDHCGAEWIDPETAAALDAATFDPAERAREKQASRDADAATLASGEKTVEQLRRENGAFAFPRDRVRLTPPKRER